MKKIVVQRLEDLWSAREGFAQKFPKVIYVYVKMLVFQEGCHRLKTWGDKSDIKFYFFNFYIFAGKMKSGIKF